MKSVSNNIWTALVLFALVMGAHATIYDVDLAESGPSPQTINIGVGDTVRWTTTDELFPHSVNSTGGAWIISQQVFDGGPPCTYLFSNTGTYTYFDNGSGMSGTVIVSAANTPPSVAVTSPANNAVLSAPATFAISASASDTGGSVASVEFRLNANVVGTDTTSPYSVTASNITSGTYTISAIATDNLGLKATNTISVVVTVPPTVTISAPTNNVIYLAPATFAVSATASDSDGIANVQFLLNTNSIGTDSTAPYSVTASNIAVGTYTLYAIATDNVGGRTTNSITVIVNGPPTVSITNPTNSSVFGAPATFTVSANASDTGGSIASVQFLIGATSLGTDTSSPYSVTASNIASGNYTLFAIATDNLGTKATNSVAISVITPPTAPSTLTALSTNSSQVYLTWKDNSANETGFVLARSTTSGGPYTDIATVNANVTNFTNIGLSPATTYYYVVRAVISAVSSSNSAPAMATTLPPQGITYNVPVTLSANQLSQQQIVSIPGPFKMVWDSGNIAVSPGVLQPTDTLVVNFNFDRAVQASDLIAMSDTNEGIYWVVGGTGSQSSVMAMNYQWQFFTTSGVIFSTTNSGSGWLRPISGGNVQGVIDTNFVYRLLDLTDSTFTFSGLRLTMVVPTNGAAWTVNTVRVAFGADDVQIISVPNAAPSFVTATPVSSSRMNLTWTDNSTNEAGFIVARGSSSTGPFTDIGTVSANVTTFSNTNLSASTTYFYVVRATNNAGSSANSLVGFARTFDPPPTYQLTTVALTGGTITRDPDQGIYISGDVVNLTATADAGYVFVGWSGDGSGTNNLLTVTMDRNKSITANFMPVSDIIVDNPQATYFGAWNLGSASADKYGSSYHYTATVNGAVTAHATFTPAITVAGKYNIYLSSPGGSTRTANAQVAVAASGVTNTFSVSQTTVFPSVVWKLLVRTMDLSPGNSAFVRLSNNTGETNKLLIADAARFTLINPPVVITPPQNTSVAAGASAKFSVLASGTDLSYQWRLNGTNIAGATGPSYTTPVTKAADNGNTYSVYMTNDAGILLSSSATLTVISAPLQLTGAGFNPQGKFRFQVNADPGSYVVECSSNLVQWTTVTNITLNAAPVLVTDPDSAEQVRFYRSRPLP